MRTPARLVLQTRGAVRTFFALCRVHFELVLLLLLIKYTTMDVLITKVSQQLGLEEAVVQKSLGAVLAFLNEQVKKKDFDFSKILSHLQGAEQLMRDADAQEAAAKGAATEQRKGPTGIVGLIFTLLKAFGVIAILKKLLSTFFGENAVGLIDTIEDGAELAVVMDKLGIDHDQGVKIVKMLVDFMKQKVSPETVEQLADSVPALKAFVGETKKEE